ncbi:hypothetical protein TorRG33x02_321280 [Trema orientale]|uniref:Uncharacterized protein n=1 Tax=Trema orientale TaxID=63057 RepID=A0A2P5BH68_TREOI|nr:hypothetical protein TorRG33x02_321280 [Trema orientale]
MYFVSNRNRKPTNNFPDGDLNKWQWLWIVTARGDAQSLISFKSMMTRRSFPLDLKLWVWKLGKEEVIWMHDASIEHLLNVEKADEACQRCGGHQRRPSLTFVNSTLKKRKSLDYSHSADPSLSEMPQST